jgi:GT2 family glycosyltransferase/tetratricopeptide (TPR) repeat protein
MSLRFLFGPVPPNFPAGNLRPEREAGRCVTFSWSSGQDLTLREGETWESLCSRLPEGWRPDFVALYLPYARVPGCLWNAPLPLVGLAADGQLQAHLYRWRLPDCDLVLTDRAGARVAARAFRASGLVGLPKIWTANLFGLDPAFLEGPSPEGPRDIDLCFCGNLHDAIQRERLPWLGRLARLGRRWNVRIATGIFGDDYRRLLARSRVVFNRSVRGEANLRVFQALAAGAVLFQEADNREVASLLRSGEEYVAYTEDNLETLLELFLKEEPLRARVAAAGRARVAEFTFPALWNLVLASLEDAWPPLRRRARRRSRDPRPAPLPARVWEACGSSDPPDAALPADLAAAVLDEPNNGVLHNGLGLAAVLESRAQGLSAEQAASRSLGYFQRACQADPGDPFGATNFALALAAAGQTREAADAARAALRALDARERHGVAGLEDPPFPPAYDLFRVEWERALWTNAGNHAAEARTKAMLLRWRLHMLLATLTGDLAHYAEAAIARPDLPATRAALGCALARAGRIAEAVPHLRAAVEGNPFDRDAARALFAALGQAGDVPAQRRFGREQRLLARAAPEAVPAEDWFTKAPPVGDELASVLILCCNELEYTRQCLESVLLHTRAPYELVLVDNGSTDGTPAFLEEFRARMQDVDPGVRVAVIRNDRNVGFPAGCNQALAEAQGDYLVFLNNDTVVTAGWLDGLVAWSLHEYPSNGLVGAVTNAAPVPQLVRPGYADLVDLPAFAAARRQRFAGQFIESPRVTGFCLLTRRDVLEQAGSFDEGYGLGFFDDDDLCVRVRRAGFRLRVALDVYVHHYGSRTFKALGVNCEDQLHDNYARFQAKWGEAESRHYRMPPRNGSVPDAASVPCVPAAIGSANGTVGPEAPGSRAAEAPADPCLVVSTAGTPLASLCMMVRNEEANLAACLSSVAGLFGDVVVVDTGSTDRTKAIAREHGARVFDFPWVDSFAAARNEGLRHARGRYIFWLDADDRLDAANRQKLAALLGTLDGANVAYVMKCLCLPDPESRTATAVDHVRLFRAHPQLRWLYRVHEQILGGLRQLGTEIRPADVVIQHTGYLDPALRRRKRERDLRLLELERKEQPDDPFILFNLGSIYQEMGRPAEALACLEESLRRSDRRDSIVRKLYALIAQCQRHVGRPGEALTTCTSGRLYYPEDVEILFQEGLARQAVGDEAGEEACWKQALGSRDRPLFGSMDTGLRGYKARHNLAVLYTKQNRLREAEEQWRQAFAERPDFFPAALGLADLFQRQGRFADLERLAAEVEARPGGEAPAALLRAHGLLGCRQYAGARQVLDAALLRHPDDLPLWVVLSHALLQEGRDPIGAEAALRRILELAPDHAEARHNLAVLQGQRRRLAS